MRESGRALRYQDWSNAAGAVANIYRAVYHRAPRPRLEFAPPKAPIGKWPVDIPRPRQIAALRARLDLARGTAWRILTRAYAIKARRRRRPTTRRKSPATPSTPPRLRDTPLALRTERRQPVGQALQTAEHERRLQRLFDRVETSKPRAQRQADAAPRLQQRILIGHRIGRVGCRRGRAIGAVEQIVHAEHHLGIARLQQAQPVQL